MESRHILQLLIGTFSILLGTMLISNFSFTPRLIDSILTFSIAFLLVLMGGILWIGTAVSIMRGL